MACRSSSAKACGTRLGRCLIGRESPVSILCSVSVVSPKLNSSFEKTSHNASKVDTINFFSSIVFL